MNPMCNATLAVERLEDRRLLAAGDLDTTFGVGGKVVQDLGILKDEEIFASAIQSDGKIVVAGSVNTPSTATRDSLVARFNSDGTLDTSFGTSGRVVLGMSDSNLDDQFNDIVIQPDGSIIVAGSAQTAGNTGFSVARLTASGQLDTSFDGDGKLVTILQNTSLQNINANANAVALQSDGKIVVGGTTNTPSAATGRDFAAARYNANGSLDTTFDGEGYVITDFASSVGSPRDDRLMDLAIQGDGKIVAVGDAEPNVAGFADFAIARYNANGSLDTTFDVDGKVMTNISPASAVSRDIANAVALEPDGQIVVAGHSEISSGVNDFIVARYNANGALDTSFAPASEVDGTLRINFGADDFGESLVLQPQPDGKYIVGGHIGLGATNDFALARVTLSGQLDTTFSGDGKAEADFAGTDFARLFDVRMQADGKIIAAGWVKPTVGNRDIALARFESGLLIAEAGGPYAIDEPGGSVILNGSGTGSGLTFEWDLDGDAVFGEVGAGALNGDENLQNPVFTVSGVDGPNNSFIVTLRVTDSTLFQAFDTATINITNVAPTLAISGAASVNEGSSYTLNLSSIDPGADTITSWTINWGDGPAQVVAGNPTTVTHTYADGAAGYTISATATDEDGAYAAGNTVAVAVGNVAPTLAISGSSNVNEGSGYTLNLSSSDPGADTITSWTINWGDGPAQIVSGNPANVTHTYADDNANYIITASATDEDGTYAAGNTVAVTVNNVAPTLTIGGVANVNESSSYTLNLSSGDPGTDTITSWTINWGDGPAQVVLGNPASVTHTYADGDINYSITASATDEDGTFAAGNTVAVTVNNVAPTLAISGAASVNEGSSYTLNLSSIDPGADTITSWTINWGDGPAQVVAGNPASVTHTYADGNANYIITASATDEDGTYAAGNTVAVAVGNVAPTLAISGATNVNEGSSYALNLSSSDPGADAITSWTINWGDGPAQVVSGNPASVTHTYADGTVGYTISATATDEDGTYAAGNTVAVTVDNVAPTADAGGPYQTFDDTPITLSGTATDPAGAADPLTFEWDLDGDNVFGETGAGAARGDELGANPTYDPIGLPTSTQTVQLRVSDGDGGITTVSTTVDILAEGTVLIGNVLYVVGSNTANDIVIISKTGSDIKVIASFNATNPMTFNESTVSEIRVRTRGGHDIVVTTPNVTKPMTIDGGNGNDLLTGGGGRNVIQGGAGTDILFGSDGDDVILGGTGNDDLFGGAGNDVLVGGDGNDVLHGGTGRDVLIGSQNEDLLNGGGDEDILIGGYTNHDDNVTALDAIMAIWGSAASFNSRIATLTGSGGWLEAGATVFDDDDCDILVGGSGRDLVFGDTNPWDGAVDLIALQVLQDVLVPVN